jgi:hypothetical protein
VIGSTNPIWIDADGDGRFTHARGYAERIVTASGGDAAKLVAALATHDEAVAVQTAALLEAHGGSFDMSILQSELTKAPPQVRRAFERVRESAGPASQ